MTRLAALDCSPTSFVGLDTPGLDNCTSGNQRGASFSDVNNLRVQTMNFCLPWSTISAYCVHLILVANALPVEHHTAAFSAGQHAALRKGSCHLFAVDVSDFARFRRLIATMRTYK